MKAILEEYGITIVCVIIALILIVSVSPIGNNIKESITTSIKKAAGIDGFRKEDVVEVEVESADIKHKWQIGPEVYATLYQNGLLHISGNGETLDFDKADTDLPWESHAASVTALQIDQTVQPKNMEWWFYNFENLSNVDIVIPASAKFVGNMFLHCPNLSGTITFAGNPAISYGCFDGVSGDLTINYTAECEDIDEIMDNCKYLTNIKKGQLVTLD